MSFQRNKILPREPLCFEYLQKENLELKERTKFFLEVIEVLYIQNLQLSTCLETRKSHDRERQLKIERVLRAIQDLSSSQARNRDTIRQLDKERQQHWEVFCQQKTFENGHQLWEYLEKLKSDMIKNQYKDLIRQTIHSEIIIGIDNKDLLDGN